MTVLLTGATGFIGSVLSTELESRDVEVATIGRLGMKSGNLNFRNVKFDLELGVVPDKWAFEGFDSLIHLAWSGLPNYESLSHLDQVHIHINFLKNAIESGIRNIFVSGTCMEYGKVEGEVKEEDLCEPSTPYGLAKLKILQQIQDICHKKSVNFSWGRLFYVYGKGQRPSALYPQIMKAYFEGTRLQLMTDGQQIRDFISVEATASIIASIVLQDSSQGVINIGSGKPTKVIDWIRDQTNSSKLDITVGNNSIPQYEPKNSWANIDKLRKWVLSKNLER